LAKEKEAPELFFVFHSFHSSFFSLGLLTVRSLFDCIIAGLLFFDSVSSLHHCIGALNHHTNGEFAEAKVQAAQVCCTQHSSGGQVVAQDTARCHVFQAYGNKVHCYCRRTRISERWKTSGKETHEDHMGPFAIHPESQRFKE
jgi:hypothetical protein